MSCWDRARRRIDVYRWERSAPLNAPSNYVSLSSSWPASLNRALETGYAKKLPTTMLAGRRVDAVLLAVPGQAGSPRYEEGTSETLYLDRSTHKPVAWKMPSGGWTRYFDTFELVANDKTNRSQLRLQASRGTRVVIHPVGQHPLERK